MIVDLQKEFSKKFLLECILFYSHLISAIFTNLSKLSFNAVLGAIDKLLGLQKLTKASLRQMPINCKITHQTITK